MTRTAAYYDAASYAADPLLRGTGVIGLLAGDQLHPPMVDDPAVWSDSRRWREGAAESVRRLLRVAGIRAQQRVLDVGCGVGGATRMLRREFGARPIGLNISGQQLHTARAISATESYVQAGVERIPLYSESVDAVITVNMFYHVVDKPAALGEIFRVTKPGGVLAFDDWVVTARAGPDERARLLEHWNPEPTLWLTDDELEALIGAAGFRIERIEDHAHIGRGVMAEHFATTFEREVRPMIVKHDPLFGAAVADHLRAAIDHTIQLYCENKMRYLQIVAVRP